MPPKIYVPFLNIGSVPSAKWLLASDVGRKRRFNIVSQLLVAHKKRASIWMPFRLAPGTWRRFTLKRDAMLAGTSHDPYTSSYHELSAAKVQSIFDTCKFWSSKCRKNLFSLLRRDKIRALAQVFRVKKWYLLFDPSWWRMIFIVLILKLLLGLSGAHFFTPPNFSAKKGKKTCVS